MRTCTLTVLVLLFLLAPLTARALSTAFTYQGRLTQAGAPPAGTYDFQCMLYDAAAGGAQVGSTVTLAGVTVANGLFTVALDFGTTPFTGADRWLAIAVRASGGGSYTPLTPRQSLAATPYALFARAVNWDDILNRPGAFGIYTAGTGLSLTGNQFSISFGTTSATAARGNHTHDAVYFKQGGNGFGDTAVLGTLDNNPVEISVYYGRAARFEPNSTSPNVILGQAENAVTTGMYGAVIAGGGQAGAPNTVGGSFGTIGGGYDHQVSNWYGTIGGGLRNTVSGASGAIAGGYQNQVTAMYGTVAGGINNIVNSNQGAIGGGYQNTISADNGSIGGGYNNQVTGYCGTVPGGNGNSAATRSFAAGSQAKATGTGCFVWGDSQGTDVASTTDNQVIFRAAGGIWLGATSTPSNPAGRFLNTSTGGYLSSTGTWTNACDRNLKTDFATLDRGDLLRALAALPITAWRYKAGDAGERHLGPTAQDFRAAFGLGLDDVSISTVDGIGIALVAAQALQAELAQVKAEYAAMKSQAARMQAENDDLRERLDNVEALVGRLQKQER